MPVLSSRPILTIYAGPNGSDKTTSCQLPRSYDRGLSNQAQVD